MSLIDDSLSLLVYDPQLRLPVDEPVTVLSDHDVLPSMLPNHWDDVDHIEIREPLSFPFEDMDGEFWNTPLLIRLPLLDPDECLALFDDVLMGHLTICDLLTAPPELATFIWRHYGFPRSMFVAEDYRPRRSHLSTSERLIFELQRRRRSLYGEWPLQARGYKKRLRLATEALARSIADHQAFIGDRPTVELHGWNVRRFMPASWNRLARVVERRPISRERLALDYHPDDFDLNSSGALASDIAIGIDNLRLPDLEYVRSCFSTLFRSLQSGGKLILFETFDGGYRPHDLIELLLDVSTHRLVLNDLHVVACSDDAAATTAIFVLTKLGPRIAGN